MEKEEVLLGARLDFAGFDCRQYVFADGIVGRFLVHKYEKFSAPYFAGKSLLWVCLSASLARLSLTPTVETGTLIMSEIFW